MTDLERGSVPDLADFVRDAARRGVLAVQPRMGMADPVLMASGLRAVAAVSSAAVGTITLDSYTRVGDHSSARQALARNEPLNGFPLVAHGAKTTRTVIAAAENRVPVQVRHGSADPRAIFSTMVAAGLSASEGGPISYCLPYGRRPLAESVRHWVEASRQLAEDCSRVGLRAHLESFGGCLLGQLCPPSLLIAITVLEAMFFAQAGVPSVSLSYAQQTNAIQDMAAITALRILADQMLPVELDRHIVVYTYMGVFPRTPQGARLLLRDSAELAVRGGADRLIVKTVVEAHRIPTVQENLDALVTADRAARAVRNSTVNRLRPVTELDCTDVLTEARGLVGAVLELSEDVGKALVHAFAAGLLDVPYCLHPDNHGESTAYIGDDGRLRWSNVGRMPISSRSSDPNLGTITSARLLQMLNRTADAYDAAGAEMPESRFDDA